jgi:hypothetical protein
MCEASVGAHLSRVAHSALLRLNHKEAEADLAAEVVTTVHLYPVALVRAVTRSVTRVTFPGTTGHIRGPNRA